MNIFTRIWNAVVTGIKAYPHGISAVLNLGVLLAARFGFHVTTNELVAVIGALNVALAAYVHGTTVTKSMIKGK